MTLLVGSTTRELGAMPKPHCIIAPIAACRHIRLSPRARVPVSTGMASSFAGERAAHPGSYLRSLYPPLLIGR